MVAGTRGASSGGTAAAPALAAAVMLLTAGAAALQWPPVWNFGYGNVTVGANGNARAVKLNKDKGRRTRAAERGAKFTVTVDAGSDANGAGGAWYTIQWSGLDRSKIKLSDRVGIFIGTTPSSSKDFIKVHFAAQATPDTYAQGYGAARFWLPYLRSDVSAAYIRRCVGYFSDLCQLPGIWYSFSSVATAKVARATKHTVPHNIKVTYYFLRTLIEKPPSANTNAAAKCFDCTWSSFYCTADPAWLKRDADKATVQYLYDLVRPSGRLYFGP